MIVKDLPIEIQELVFKRRRTYGDKDDNKETSVSEGNRATKKGFDWSESTEGYDFWEKINKGDFTEFYEKYPKKESYKMLTRPVGSILLKVIKPLTCSGWPHVVKNTPKVGDLTWALQNHIDHSYFRLIENNRYGLNFDKECFEIVKENEKFSYIAFSRPSGAIALRIIKPLKSLNNSSADSTLWPKVGDITWESSENLPFIGIPGAIVLLEDNRHYQNFCGGSFEIVSEISSGATDKHIVPIVTDTHSMSSGLHVGTSTKQVVDPSVKMKGKRSMKPYPNSTVSHIKLRCVVKNDIHEIGDLTWAVGGEDTKRRIISKKSAICLESGHTVKCSDYEVMLESSNEPQKRVMKPYPELKYEGESLLLVEFIIDSSPFLKGDKTWILDIKDRYNGLITRAAATGVLIEQSFNLAANKLRITEVRKYQPSDYKHSVPRYADIFWFTFNKDVKVNNNLNNSTPTLMKKGTVSWASRAWIERPFYTTTFVGESANLGEINFSDVNLSPEDQKHRETHLKNLGQEKTVSSEIVTVGEGLILNKDGTVSMDSGKSNISLGISGQDGSITTILHDWNNKSKEAVIEPLIECDVTLKKKNKNRKLI